MNYILGAIACVLMGMCFGTLINKCIARYKLKKLREEYTECHKECHNQIKRIDASDVETRVLSSNRRKIFEAKRTLWSDRLGTLNQVEGRLGVDP